MIVHFHPPSKTFTTRDNGGKFEPRNPGVVVTGKPGIVKNTPPTAQGLTILKAPTKGV